MRFLNLPWTARLFRLAIAASVGFFVLTTLAMLTYAGGTLAEPQAPHYRFFENPFSDLGRTHVFDGRSNTISMVLFVIAMVCGAMGLAAFFTGFYAVTRGTMARVMSFGGWFLGVGSGTLFCGGRVHALDIYVHLHMHFVFGAFRLLLIATVLDLGAVLACPTIPRRLVMAFAVFILLLIAYIILLTAGLSGGPASNAVLQTTGQKLIAYASIAMVIVQSVLIGRMVLPATVSGRESCAG